MNNKELLRPALINLTAEIEGVTPRSVRRVLKDEQANEDVYDTFLYLKERMSDVVEEVKMIREVEKLVVFPKL